MLVLYFVNVTELNKYLYADNTQLGLFLPVPAPYIRVQIFALSIHLQLKLSNIWLSITKTICTITVFFLVLISYIFSLRCRAVDKADYLSAFELTLT